MIYTSRTFPIEYPLEEADCALLGIPWDSTELGKSVKYGPLFIREALKNMPGFDPETKKNIFELLKFHDLGDVEVVAGNWALTSERIRDTVQYLQKTNSSAFPIFLGGDHLITLAILEALKTKPTIVHFDAHADLCSEWMGEPFSHISWGFHVVKKGFDLVQIGVRSMTGEEQDFLGKHPLKKLEEISGPVYVTIDLDVIDPAFAPEVGTPEPLGMTPREFFSVLQKVCSHTIVGMDIVECSSERVNTPTALLAAQMIKKTLCWRL